jgi:chromosomal replication initiation ATPase DnaA
MLADRRQLPLPFPDAEAFDARDFIVGEGNREALAWLHADWPDRRLLIWGSPGCGKSHLLHAWAAEAGAPVVRGLGLRPEALPDAGAFAIDDADLVAPDPLLLHSLNLARERGLRLLLSARLPPSGWHVQLPDLASRLRAIAAVAIGPPDDRLLAALLVRLFAKHQMQAAAPLRDWLLTRLPRSAAALRLAVDRLARTSLALGRPVTRGMAESVLADLVDPATDVDEILLADEAARLTWR